jgi:hypothetical protein
LVIVPSSTGVDARVAEIASLGELGINDFLAKPYTRVRLPAAEEKLVC